MNRREKTTAVVKSTFFNIVNDLNKNSIQYVNAPGKDFTRTRKISFRDVIKMSVLMETSSIQGELLDYFSCSTELPTTTAFIRQRAKIKTLAYKTMFNKLGNSFEHIMKKLNGFRIIGVDGSVVITPPNKKEPKLLRQITPNYAFNSVHLNAFYDIVNHVYVDAEIDDGFKAHENEAFLKMLYRCENVEEYIFLADRGYEACNLFAHMTEKKCHYVFRAQDIDKCKILHRLNLPDKELDIDIVKKIFKNYKDIWQFTTPDDPDVSIIREKRFDFYTDDKPYYFLPLRIIRVALPNGGYEALITNLTRQEATFEEIVELYKMRWQTEESFRELKYEFKLTSFHTKQQIFIEQEIYSRLTMFNICGLILCILNFKWDKDTKHKYKINMATASKIVRAYLDRHGSHIEVGKLIFRFLIPIRPGRSAPRRTRTKQSRTAQYR